MTVAMLVRGATKSESNALLVDLVVGVAREDGSFDYGQGEQDKIRGLFDRTYVSAIGDASLLQALGFLTEWLDPARPDLRDPAILDAVLTSTERIRQLYGYTNDPRGAVLLVCTSDAAYYWTSSYNPETKTFSRPDKPVLVPPGGAFVFWGDEVIPIEGFQPGDDTVRAMQRVVASIIDNARSHGKGIKYDPHVTEGRFSAVAVPCDATRTVVRRQAFNNLPELLANFFGAGGLKVLREHPEFREFPLTHDVHGPENPR